MKRARYINILENAANTTTMNRYYEIILALQLYKAYRIMIKLNA